MQAGELRASSRAGGPRCEPTLPLPPCVFALPLSTQLSSFGPLRAPWWPLGLAITALLCAGQGPGCAWSSVGCRTETWTWQGPSASLS